MSEVSMAWRDQNEPMMKSEPAASPITATPRTAADHDGGGCSPLPAQTTLGG